MAHLEVTSVDPTRRRGRYWKRKQKGRKKKDYTDLSLIQEVEKLSPRLYSLLPKEGSRDKMRQIIDAVESRIVSENELLIAYAKAKEIKQPFPFVDMCLSIISTRRLCLSKKAIEGKSYILK